jgi:hypothetical protein
VGILFARANGDQQVSVVGQQFGGRVGLFLRVGDFEASYERMIKADVRFVSAPRTEAHGRVAVFTDLEGNRWDLAQVPKQGRLAEPSYCPEEGSCSSRLTLRIRAMLNWQLG